MHNTHRIALAAPLLVSPAVIAQELEVAQVLEPIPDRAIGWVFGSTYPEGADDFGARIAFDDDVLAIGDPLIYFDPFPLHGRVYLYERGTEGNWIERQVLSASEPDVGDRFGADLALEQGKLVVSLDDSPSDRFGKILTFTQDEAGHWSEIPGTALNCLRLPNDRYFYLRNNTLLCIGPSTDPARPYPELNVFDWDGQAGWVRAQVPDVSDLNPACTIIKEFDGNTIWAYRCEPGSEISDSIIVDRQPDGSWVARPPFDPPRLPGQEFDFESSLIYNGNAIGTLGAYASETRALVPTRYVDGEWLGGGSVVPPLGPDTQIFYQFQTDLDFLEHTAASGDMFFAGGELQGSSVPFERGIHAFKSDPTRGLIPQRFRSIPIEFGYFFGSMTASKDQLFVAVAEQAFIPWSPNDPSNGLFVRRPRVLVVDRSQFEDPCTSDFAHPADTLDLADIARFLQEFQQGTGTRADLAPPFGVYDTADVAAFIGAFLTGCK